MGRYQQKLVGLCEGVKGWRSNIPTVFLYDSGPESAPGRPGVNVVGSCPQPGIRVRPLTPQARLAQAARTRNQAKASTSQEPPRGEHELGRRKEAVEVEDDDDEEEEDERLRREEDQRAEQRARKKGIRGEAEPVIQDGPPKKKKYTVRLEEGFDVEKVIDRLLEGHNDLMTLKEILASAPRLRDELKERLSRRLVPNVHLGTILPKEAEWAESGTKMDWKCVACGTVDLMVKGSKSAAMVDTGAEMNIIRDADAIRFGLDIDRSDCGILHGANCKAMFCGTASNVLVEVGKVKESLDQSGSLNPVGNVDEIPESQDDEFEEGEIKEAFRAEEYDGIYLELGLLLSCEMRLRDVNDRAKRMLQRYLVRDGHLFVRREVGNPRRVVCGRNRQIDVVAALHDGIAGGYRGVQATYAKISDLYYWDGMMDMVGKFCRSCVPCQERSRLRQGEPLHPRLEREVGAVVHLDLLFMPLGDQGYNYIFDARDNLSGFVDGRAIRTKTGSVLVSCIEEYYLRYPFFREFVMDRGSEFTCQEVQELLARVERRQRSQRPRDPEPREARPSRGGRKALARREQEPEDEERGAYPECGLGPVEFHLFTEGGLRRSPAHTQGEPPASEGPLRKLEMYLDTSQWRASLQGEEYGEQAEEVPREEVPQGEIPREEMPREEVPQEEVQGTQRERGLGDEGRRAGKEVIEVGEDTPPQTPSVGLRLGDTPGSTRQANEGLQREETPLPSSEKAPSPEGRAERRKERAAVRREALILINRHLAAHALEHPDLEEPTPAEPRQESCQPEKEMEAEIPKRVDLRTRERVPAEETAEEKRARRTRRIDEIWQERQRSEAPGALPGQPPSAPAKASEIPEIWRDFWEQRGEKLPSPVRAGFGVARKAEERLDRKIKFLAKTTFDRYLLLEGDLAGKRMKEASHGVRLEAMEVEIQELRALVASQAAIIESLRQQTQGKADRPESSRQGEQRQPGQGLPGQPSATEPRQEPPMGRVILKSEEARAQRQAER
ncbi:hypothetical protein CBR_g25865 [Chara braunii]|uniref:Integrase catalytic domain-containing protein n=1 Tax=Chara braunii TaxID=69332 RepID=A0A388L6M3_CHABU|nr:hypothetical protein CBR_g25865 [Chara braunii]|eukprot:GBG77934.1 hypothetical protein CBR_g25865 [Chara braunii]